jgi:hypothetical protein
MRNACRFQLRVDPASFVRAILVATGVGAEQRAERARGRSGGGAGKERLSPPRRDIVQRAADGAGASGAHSGLPEDASVGGTCDPTNSADWRVFCAASPANLTPDAPFCRAQGTALGGACRLTGSGRGPQLIVCFGFARATDGVRPL